MTGYDVAIVGGGIIGTSAAAYLAESGRSVVLFERANIAAGASGRNSGAVQHPFDPVLTELHRRSLDLYRDSRLAEAGFALPMQPAGLLLLSFDADAVALAASDLSVAWPELAPEILQPGSAAVAEPMLDARLAACRIETGYTVAPATATLAFARRAQRAGAVIEQHREARPAIDGGRVRGVLARDGSVTNTVAADEVLVAAGPWTPELIEGWDVAPPIGAIWGVVVSFALGRAPVHVLEELGIDRPGARPERLFSMVTAHGRTSVGSTFLAREPDPRALASEIVERATAFVPSLTGATIASVRSCARPVAFDGRPLVGAVPGVEGLFVCAGHGPWGISTGPASAELVVEQMLGVAADRAELSAARFQPPVGARNTEFA